VEKETAAVVMERAAAAMEGEARAAVAQAAAERVAAALAAAEQAAVTHAAAAQAAARVAADYRRPVRASEKPSVVAMAVVARKLTEVATREAVVSWPRVGLSYPMVGQCQ
jgi:hypothetical protein